MQGLRIGDGILERDVDLEQIAVADRSRVPGWTMWYWSLCGTLNSRTFAEVGGIDDKRGAFPPGDRMTHHRRIGVAGRVLAAVQVDASNLMPEVPRQSA